MNPVHHYSFFFLSYLCTKTPKYQLGSFTVHFSAMRTNAPSLVRGSAAVSASCLSQNVRPAETTVNLSTKGLLLLPLHAKTDTVNTFETIQPSPPPCPWVLYVGMDVN